MILDQFKRKKESKNTPVLVFDFGTSSAKILLCDYGAESVEIIDGEKLKYPKGCFDTDGRIVAGSLNQPLLDAKQSVLARNEGFNPNKAVIGLGGISVEGYTSKINYRRAAPEKKIKEVEFKNILKRVEDRADQIMRKMIAWEIASDEDIRLISSEVLALSVNGYETESAIGSIGERLTFEVYNSYTQDKTLSNLLDAIKFLGLEAVSVASTCYAVTRLVIDLVGKTGSGVVLDIGAGSTGVGVIDRGRILGHVEFDVAGDSFTQAIASELEYDLEHAETVKLGYAGGKLPASQMKEVREVVAQDCKVFLNGVELVLSEFPGLQEIPAKFFLIGGGSLLPGVSSSLQSASMSNESVSVELRTEFIEPKRLSGFIDKTGKLNSPADVPVVALALDAIDLMAD